MGGGKYLHVRCVAHILNLVVWDGLKESQQYVDRIRALVKYVRKSPSRLQKCKECAELEKISCKGSLSLDVCTRWNSTFHMLSRACEFEKAFKRYSARDPFFRYEIDELGDRYPTPEDWSHVRKLTTLLEGFYKATLSVSGSKYVTSNECLFELVDIFTSLNEWLANGDLEFVMMARRMKEKFDKYWGNFEKMNVLVFVAVILEPRRKLGGAQVALRSMYRSEKGDLMFDLVKDASRELFEEYKKKYVPPPPFCLGRSSGQTSSLELSDDQSHHCAKKLRRMDAIRRMNGDEGGVIKSELDRYLNESNDFDDTDEDFDVLKWWRVHGIRFPVLSHLECNVLAMSISTVASESTFSTGGRHLDQFRSSLTPKMVQGLICAQDWIKTSDSINTEECIEVVENWEEELISMDGGGDLAFEA